MQPVSPIPHLAPSATIRPRRQAKGAQSFNANLAQLLERVSAASLHAPQSTRRVGTARASGVGRRPAASLVRFERPRVYRYVDDPARASDMMTDSADSSTRTRSAGTRRKDNITQVEESTKAALVRRIHTFARRLGVDPTLSEAIARVESGLDQTAWNPDGQTKGAFQMKDMTAAAMHERLQNDPARLPLSDEVTLGIGYLRYLDGLFATRSVLDRAAHTTTPVSDDDERRRFAIAAYNAGEGRVAEAQRKALSAGGDPRQFDDVRPFLPAVTQRYVNRVLTLAATARGSSDTPIAGAVD
jgi:soluble lytic murein transglycosylase-like protein